jgi:hypothetical protein
MPRPLTPFWLSAPSRFAGLPRPRARAALVALVLLVLLSLTAIRTPGPPPVSGDPAKRADDQADVVLYDTIVEGVRHGGNYYHVAAAALRAGDYPLRPFVTFRLPTLAMVQASLPPPVTVALLYLLAAGTMIAWGVRLRRAFARPPPLIVALVLLAGGLVAFVQADLVGFHEVWAGLLVALSLAVRRPGRWLESVALGLCAMLVRETAVLFAAVMGAAALWDRQWREAAGWAAAGALFAGLVALHAWSVAQVVRPLDPHSPGWSGLLGFGFFVKAASLSTALALAPTAVAAPLVALALFGWAAWRDPLAVRALATLLAYAALLAVAGRPDTFYWALLVAPILLVGLAFVPDGLRDLVAGALDRRRIVVTRVVR